jgi:protocatechuate 3,4-dioxygenase beta subunit
VDGRERAGAAAPAAERAGSFAARWVDVALTDEGGRPLAGAPVAIAGHAGARPAGRTDALGRLRVPLDLADLASAHPHWPLAGDAVELVLAAQGRAARNAFVFLPESGGTPLRLALAPAAPALEGRLLDAEGRPLAGAHVQVGPASGLGARERLDVDGRAVAVVRARAAVSDAQGRFRVEGLPREPLRLAARADGHALAALELGLDENDVELRLERAEPLRGAVRLGGAPAPGARVEWSAVGGPTWPAEWCRGQADAAGRFELPRPAHGTLALVAGLDGARAAAELALDADPAIWNAELARARELAVRLLEADGRPAAGLYLCLRAADGGALLAAAESDAEGRARFATEAAGPCDLVVLPARGTGTWPREVLRELPGAGGPELVLRLAADGGGTAALSARFAPGGDTRLVLRHVEGLVEHTAAADAQGRLAWDALPAGRWSARALLGEGRERTLGEFELSAGETLDLGHIE